MVALPCEPGETEACDVRTLTIILSLALVSTPVLADVVQRDALPAWHQPQPAGELEAIYAGESDGEPWTQDAKLEPSEPRPNEWAGYAVDIDGDTAVVGATSFPPLDRPGRAFIYERGPNGWTQTATLTGDNPGDIFGTDVAIQDDTIVIGAPWGDTPDAEFAGGVHIFERTASTWTKTATFAGQDSTLGDDFGSALALDGDLLVVGARNNAPGGVDGAGSVYVFERSSDGWTQVAKLIADEPAYGAWFGHAVDLDEGTILVGSYRYSAEVKQGGTAYLFEKKSDGSGWAQTIQFRPGTPERFHTYGFAVAIDDDLILIGEPGRWDFSYPGTVYIYERAEDGAWTETTQLHGDRDPENTFGQELDLEGQRAIVGAPTADDIDIPGDLPPAPNQETFDGSGAVFVYHREDGSWLREAKLMASDRGHFGPVAADQGAPPWGYDRFGFGAALSGATIIVGAYGDDPGSTEDAGAAYIYTPGCDGHPVPPLVSPPLTPCLSPEDPLT